MKTHRSLTVFSISRLIVILFLFIAASAHAVEKDPAITSVTVTNDSSIIVDIIGANFTAGNAAPVVTLGGQVMTVDIGTLLDTFVSASLPAAFLPGDYSLTVNHSKGVAQYDLTIVAVGPPDLANEVCSLYGLTGFPAPLSVVSESPEATCDDGLDNDCDGDVDIADTDCAVAVVCFCATIYADAIAVYTAQGGDLEDGWDTCVSDTGSQVFSQDDTLGGGSIALSAVEPFMVLPGACEASVGLPGGGSAFSANSDLTLDAAEVAACAALQESICNPP